MPRLGKALLVLLGIVVVIIAAGALWLYEMDQTDKHEREIAKTKISPSQIELSDLLLRPSYGNGDFALVGRIKNRSPQYALDGLKLKLLIRDCDSKAECEVVGETEVNIYTDVPAGQSRDLEQSVYFRNLCHARGKHEWEYRVLEISGK